MQFLAQSFVSTHEAAPRAAALFATQQRWLLCHAALSHYFRTLRDGTPDLTRRRLGQLALQYGIASRNTANAFFDEALKYEVIQSLDGSPPGPAGPVAPSPTTLAMLQHWYGVHFHALDLIDGGDRTLRFLTGSDRILPVIAPPVAEALLASPEVRAPGPLYTIFTWADAGGLLMDRLIAGADEAGLGSAERLATDVTSISSLAQAFGLSRAHASRKIAAAESLGDVGWSGQRGRSALWISRTFQEEYARSQARKLVVLDHAFSEIAG